MVTHVLGITCRRRFKKKKKKEKVACCITALMYPICGATLNFRLNLFLSFVLDDMVPEFFLFADVTAAKTAASNACFLAGSLPRLPGYHWSLIVSSEGHRV